MSTWYDADADGLADQNYNYGSDIQMTQTRAENILGYPADETGNPQPFTSLASNYMNLIDAVIYSNHAAALRLQKPHGVWRGTLVSRDEAIVFNGSARFVYDSRIHSRYSDDPNRFIDFALPIANKVRIEHVEEITPVEGYYAAQ
jgi:hypothetical protein